MKALQLLTPQDTWKNLSGSEYRRTTAKTTNICQYSVEFGALKGNIFER
jgi:hypothetical protein